jgi:hypothetical protein
MAKITAFYGDATSCIKYSLDPIDYAATQRAPDAGKWSLTPQSGTIIIDPSFATLPPVVRYDLVTSWPNRNGWSPGIPGINGGLSGNFGYSGWGGGAG